MQGSSLFILLNLGSLERNGKNDENVNILKRKELFRLNKKSFS